MRASFVPWVAAAPIPIKISRRLMPGVNLFFVCDNESRPDIAMPSVVSRTRILFQKRKKINCVHLFLHDLSRY